MATTNTRYIDVDADVGGDGTTNGLTGGTCAYKSLAIWEAARQANLPSGDIIEQAICCSNHANHTAETTGFTIDGWTTDATRYITIEAEVSHGGKWNTTVYRRVVAAGGPGDAVLLEDFIRFVGMQMKWEGNAGFLGHDGFGAGRGAGARHYHDKCIYWSSGATNNGGGSWYYYNGANDAHVVVRNCLFYDFIDTTPIKGAGWVYEGNAVNNQYKLYLYNCTIQNCGYGLRQGTSNEIYTVSYVKNCGFSGCSTAIYRTTGTVNETTNNTSTPTFVDGGNDDFHLAAGDSTWKNQGTDLSGDTYPVTTDIDGDARSGTYDIGADEYISSGSPWYAFAQQ